MTALSYLNYVNQHATVMGLDRWPLLSPSSLPPPSLPSCLKEMMNSEGLYVCIGVCGCVCVCGCVGMCYFFMHMHVCMRDIGVYWYTMNVCLQL